MLHKYDKVGILLHDKVDLSNHLFFKQKFYSFKMVLVLALEYIEVEREDEDQALIVLSFLRTRISTRWMHSFTRKSR